MNFGCCFCQRFNKKIGKKIVEDWVNQLAKIEKWLDWIVVIVVVAIVVSEHYEIF